MTSYAIPLIKGFMIGSSDEDWLLVVDARRPTRLTAGDVAMMAHSFFFGAEPPSVSSIEDYAPDSVQIRLVFGGDLERTGAGKRLREAIFALNELRNGPQDAIPCFAPFPVTGDMEALVKVNPGGCPQTTNGKLFLFHDLGFSLGSAQKGRDERGKAFDEWLEQLMKRYDELETAYPALRDLNNTMRVFALFHHVTRNGGPPAWLRQQIDSVRPEETPTSPIVPGTTGSRVFVNISSQREENVGSIPADPGLDVLSKRLESIHFTDANYSRTLEEDLSKLFDAPLKGARLMASLLKNSPALSRSFIIHWDSGNAGSQPEGPKAEISDGDRLLQLPLGETKRLQILLNQTLREKAVPESEWQTFYEKNLACLKPVGGSIGTPLLFASPDIRFEWLKMDNIAVLRDHHFLVLVPYAHGSDPDLKAVVGNLAGLPVIKDCRMGVVLTDVSPEASRRWEALHVSLGEGNVLINPTKGQLKAFLEDEGRNVIMLDVHVEDGKMKLADGELGHLELLRYKRLTHLRLVVLGLFSPAGRSWDEMILRAMKTKGTGVVSITRIMPGAVLDSKVRRLVEILGDPGVAYRSVLELTHLVAEKERTTVWANLP